MTHPAVVVVSFDIDEDDDSHARLTDILDAIHPALASRAATAWVGIDDAAVHVKQAIDQL